MLYTYPDYYKDFKCIADRCQDTCCAGWQIVIDDESLENYKSLPPKHPFKDKLNQSIDWQEGVFKQDACRRCAFLNAKNLCDLYTALGEESLCYTCTSYPRHTEEYEGVREVTLSLSCPEVARMVLEKTDKATFYEVEGKKKDIEGTKDIEGIKDIEGTKDIERIKDIEGTKNIENIDDSDEIENVEDIEDYEDFDDFDGFDMLMFGILQDIRSAMIDIMQDRSRDIADRTATIWHMAEELQECIDDGDVFACEDIIERYTSTNKDGSTTIETNTATITIPVSKQQCEKQNISQALVDNQPKNQLQIQAKIQPQNRQLFSDETNNTPHYTHTYTTSLSLFKHLYRLEVLNPDWEQQVDEASLALYGQDAEYYERISQEFNHWLHANKPNWQIQCEQIVVYFLATYLCGAVYDGQLAAKVKMSVASIFYIHELLMAQWLMQERELSDQDIISVVYRYSRELEHSDINLEELETCYIRV